ncbi:kinase-like domain-containing protein [Mycotypha africana]|uniref:kinase-like domain-containing protein n=1 Tax=Mycotypha africana TaxID=64632 RepID=UPI002301CFD2|nr:kinase-like domain-containing protein [Mycotypha africana]KAI8977056.1 kinase-like domain-containing protein [Mycotypha africana]
MVIINRLIPNGLLIDNLRIIDVLGKGAYGQVYLARHEEENKLYAIKTIPSTATHQLHQQPQQQHRASVLQERIEIGLHARLTGHPNIIELKRVIRDHHLNYTHIVMEYGPDGDLFSTITERDLYAGNHALIRKVFLQILDAVSYCHENGVYHRDLKPENILVFDEGRTVKLADFGLATTNTVSHDYGCGSTFYYSPECCGCHGNRDGYATAPNDIWALGIILINLATGRNAWGSASLKDETFRAYLANNNFLLNILPISRELNRILKRIFCINPEHRIQLDELRERIRQCRYFTRTAEVDQWEESVRKAKYEQKKCMKIALQQQQLGYFDLRKPIDAPITPPSTPPHITDNRSTSPTLWQQRIAVTTTITTDERPITPP